jgi:hypothetical protein
MSFLNKSLFVFLFLAQVSFGQSVNFADQIEIRLYPNTIEMNGGTTAMAELSKSSPLWKYHRRFDYLILNTPAIHAPENGKWRSNLFSLYPDTVALKKAYVSALTDDTVLQTYFQTAQKAILNPQSIDKTVYDSKTLFEVASRFFFCDRVNSDSTVQAHVCIGINGVMDIPWDRDYTLLAAFCYEAIFNDFDQEFSLIDVAFTENKSEATQENRAHLNNKEEFLMLVRNDLYSKMAEDQRLQKILLTYYRKHKADLCFRIKK